MSLRCSLVGLLPNLSKSGASGEIFWQPTQIKLLKIFNKNHK